MTTVSDALLERLRQWGVRRVFGFPGDGINGIMGAFNRAGNRPEFIQARHEEMAAFMACGHAKFTGEVGVCTATSGPGAIHLLNGLYDARLDHQPVVAIVGQQATTALGSHYQQEVDLALAVQGRRRRVRDDDHHARAAARRRRPGDAHRRRRADGHLPDPPQRRAGDGRGRGRRTRSRWRPGASGIGLAHASCPPTTSCGGRPTCSTPARRWRSSSGRALARPPTRWSRSPTCSAPAWPRRCSARTCSTTTCPSSPDRSACSAPSRATR